MHWICNFFSICSVSTNIWCFHSCRWRDWFLVFICPTTKAKCLHDILSFMLYLDNKFVWFTHSLLIWFLRTVIVTNHPNLSLFESISIFIWWLTKFLVYFQFGRKMLFMVIGLNETFMNEQDRLLRKAWKSK